MQRKKRKYKRVPDPPADAANFILVRTVEGPYWRRKRGTVKKAELNPVLKKNAEAAAIASPAAKRIRDKLGEFLEGLRTGRFIANISAKLRRTYLESGKLDFSLLKDYDLQPDYPIGSLLNENIFVTVSSDEIIFQIPVHAGTVNRHNKLVSAYYFEAILLWGDPSKKNGLKIDSVTSPLYTFDKALRTECRLALSLPAKKQPWMAMIKLSCHEGNSPAYHPRHYGMKVVKAG